MGQDHPDKDQSCKYPRFNLLTYLGCSGCSTIFMLLLAIMWARILL